MEGLLASVSVLLPVAGRMAWPLPLCKFDDDDGDEEVGGVEKAEAELETEAEVAFV